MQDESQNQLVEPPVDMGRSEKRARRRSSPDGLAYLLILALGIFLGWTGNELTDTGQGSEPSAARGATAAINEGNGPESEPVLLPEPPLPELSESYRTMGDPQADVVIVEYSDYQCPFCRRHALEVFPALKTKYIDTGQVYYVFKDFPIASLHPLAYRQHEAASCAGQLAGGQAYWQAHELFFAEAELFQVETVASLDTVILSQFATARLPDVSRCLASNEFADQVQRTVTEGQTLGISGTPAFFINGFPITGAQPLAVFEEAIALAQKGELAALYRPAANGPNDGKAQATAAALANQPVVVPISDEPGLGNPDAPVVIVEYSDFQCPFCRRHALETMPQLRQYIEAGQVYYLFKDFPILSIHPQAQKAHEAARCVRELAGDEAYWQMHDLLFAEQASWSSRQMPEHVATFLEMGGRLGIDEEQLSSCLATERQETAIAAQVNEGLQFGLTGTPTFFINGQRLVGAQPASVFVQIIESFLADES